MQMDTKIEVKQEDPLLDNIPASTNVAIKTKSDLEVAVKTEVKLETPFTEFCSQEEAEFLPVVKDKKYNSDNEIYNKIEVKEEPYWLKTETSCVYDDIKDGDFRPVTLLQVGDFTPVKSARICTGVPGVSSGKSPLSCDEKDNSEYPSQKIEHCHSQEPGKCRDKNIYNSILNLNQNNYTDKDERQHRCNICEKRFTRLSSLKMHNFIHEGKKPHKCNICGKNFAHLSYLKLHNLIHEVKKPHKCNICDKSFPRLPSLKLHILIHEGKKPHKCDICEKSFTQLSHLKRHNLIHEGKKPFKCEICDKSFTELSTLRRHKLIHEGTKPYRCETCDKRFTQLSALKRHNLIHQRHKAV